jgi:hypothetical protein
MHTFLCEADPAHADRVPEFLEQIEVIDPPRPFLAWESGSHPRELSAFLTSRSFPEEQAMVLSVLDGAPEFRTASFRSFCERGCLSDDILKAIAKEQTFYTQAYHLVLLYGGYPIDQTAVAGAGIGPEDTHTYHQSSVDAKMFHASSLLGMDDFSMLWVPGAERRSTATDTRVFADGCAASFTGDMDKGISPAKEAISTAIRLRESLLAKSWSVDDWRLRIYARTTVAFCWEHAVKLLPFAKRSDVLVEKGLFAELPETMQMICTAAGIQPKSVSDEN